MRPKKGALVLLLACSIPLGISACGKSAAKPAVDQGSTAAKAKRVEDFRKQALQERQGGP